MDGIRFSRLGACILLLIAALPLPYSYYMFLRVAITIISAVNVFIEAENKNKYLLVFFAAMAILFNPIFPVHLMKSAWIPINIVSGIIFGLIGLKDLEEDNS